jgi:uncharacterized Zn finger protein
MGRYDNYGYPPYVSKAEKIARAAKSRAKMAKKGVHLEPVIIEGRTIARTWWGQGWVKNLERYADYENRLPRGRSYLRNGSILDLKIEKNRVTALVSGSRSTPYKIDIAIASPGNALKDDLMTKSRSALDSMQALLSGEFPEDLKEEFFKKERGLFPSPKEIQLDCSCPDWATMCKHVAAALYGVAVRLDEKPELFFLLRGIDITTFVAEVAKEETAKLLEKADQKSSRVLDDVESDDEMGALFGISFESDTADSDSKDSRVTAESFTVSQREGRKTVKKSGVKVVKKVAKKADSKLSVKKVSSRAANTKVITIEKPVKKASKKVKNGAMSTKHTVPAKKVAKKKNLK